LHQVGSGLVQIDGVFDGIGARLNAIAQALAPECVAGSFFPVAMRLIHDGIHFFLCERRVAKQFAIWFEFVVGGRMKLDPVSAIVDLLSKDRKSTRLNSSHQIISYA